MSEVIELTEKDLELGPDGTFFGWFIMETLGAYLDASKGPWTFDRRLEVSLTINGKEIPIRPVIDMIEKDLDRMVLKRAEALLKSKLDKVSDMIYQVERHVRDKCLELELTLREE